MPQSEAEIFPETQSIQTHLGIIQSVIQRMATNSTNSKAWCVSLVAAILVIVADKGNPDYAWIALMPTIIFAFLDAYYLALEKGFRESYNNFISKVHQKNLTEDDLFSVRPAGSMSRHQMEALKSFSIWGFYFSMAFLIFITKEIALAT
ncbi:hypothetical protein [Thiomicrospira sp. WB1]|uniref:hypothetical protein n=1 Tax=Thiomicrospira sp. WB1 TaxID=1685380 RepID=UPI0007491589|nr:hypothetical protein [Thiomicrospira sp. WB1]KUJ71664.1 hypothetical protein AVO41_09125 [Thiomicrospira sp. WB1]